MTHTTLGAAALALFISTPALAGGGPTFTLSGACPGPMDFTASGLTPSGGVALLRAQTTGSVALPGGPCIGAVSGLGSAGLTLQTVVTADGAGELDFSVSIPSPACDNIDFQFLDIDTCTFTNTQRVPAAEPSPTVEFPRSESVVVNAIGGTTDLGSGGGGLYFVAGTYIEDRYDNLGLSSGSVSGVDMDFMMSDFTNSFCVVGTLTFDVTINGSLAGTYSYAGGGSLGDISFTESFSFPPIAGTGPDGDEFAIRITANETVCPGGGSYNWYPGGVTTFVE